MKLQHSFNACKMLNSIIQAVKFLEPQIRLASKAGKMKKEYKLSMLSDRTLDRVRELAEAPIEAVFTDPTYGKVCDIIYAFFISIQFG